MIRYLRVCVLASVQPGFNTGNGRSSLRPDITECQCGIPQRQGHGCHSYVARGSSATLHGADSRHVSAVGGLVLTSGRVGSVDQTDTQSLRVSGSRAGNAGEVAGAVALKEVCSSGTSTSSSRSAAPAMPNAQATAMAVVRLSTNIIQGRTAPARSLRKLFWNHWLFCASAGVPRLTATLSDQGSSLCCPPACEAFNYQRKIDFDICFFFPPRSINFWKLNSKN